MEAKYEILTRLIETVFWIWGGITKYEFRVPKILYHRNIAWILLKTTES